MKTLLGILGSLTIAGNGGSTFVIANNSKEINLSVINKNNYDENVDIARKNLGRKIIEAQNVWDGKKTEAYKHFYFMIKDAILVWENQNSSEEELNNWTIILDKEIKRYKEAKTDFEIAKENLEIWILVAEEKVENIDGKDEATYAELREAIQIAKKVLNKENVTVEELKVATEDLEEAVRKFLEAPSETNKARIVLKRKIQEALTIRSGSPRKPREVEEKFDKVFEKAVLLSRDEYATTIQLNEMIEELDQAIKEFKAAKTIIEINRDNLNEKIIIASDKLKK